VVVEQQKQSQGYHPLLGWVIWLVAALFYAYEFTHRVSPSVMVPELMTQFGVTRAELGHLSAYYFYAYAFWQIPAGILIDKYGPRLLLILAALIVVFGSFLMTTAETLVMANISRLLIGTGSAFAFVGCLKIGSKWLSAKQFPLLVGLTNFFGALGAILGGGPLAISVDLLGWRLTLVMLTFIGAVITLLLWAIVYDPNSSQDAQTKQKAEPGPSFVTGLVYVIRSKQTWLIALYATLLVIPIVAFAELWSVRFFEVVHGMSKTKAASMNSIVFTGILIGGPVIGWLASRWPQLKTIMILCTLSALICLLGVLYVNNLTPILLGGLLFFYGAMTANMLLCFTLITKLHPQWMSATAIGIVNTFVMAGGAVFQPLLGKLLDLQLGNLYIQAEMELGSDQYKIAVLILPLCLVLALSLTRFIKTGHKRAHSIT